MSGSTRAPDEARSQPGESPEPAEADGYVDRLADRLGGPPEPGPHAAPPLPVSARPQALGPRSPRRSVPPRRLSVPAPPGDVDALAARPPVETSDVRAMPEERDDAISIPPAPPAHPPEEFAEFERDELAPEATSVDDRDALASESTQIIRESPAMPVLYVEAGRDKGREYVLVEGETTVGRGIDNEVILADVSVSRRHLRIVREGEVLAFRDLGSGNGTLVNGRRAHSMTLVDGDRIELGETVMVVRVPGSDLGLGVDGSSEPEAFRSGESTTDETANPGGTLDVGISGTPWSVPPPAATSQPAAAMTGGWQATGERTSAIVLDRKTLLIAAVGIAIAASVLGAVVVAIVIRSSQGTVATTLPSERPVIAVPSYVPGVGAAPATGSAPAVATGAAPPPVVVVPPAIPPGAVVPPAEVIPPAAVVPPPGASVATGAAAQIPGTTTTGAATGTTTGTASQATTGSATAGAETEPSPEVAARPERRSTTTRPVRAPRQAATATARPARGADGALTAYRAGDFPAASRAARAAELAPLAAQIDQFAGHYRNVQSAARGSPAAITAMERAIALDNQIVRGGHYATRLRPQLVGAYLDTAQASMSARPQDACRRVQQALRLEGGSSRAQSMARTCETQAQRILADAVAAERSDAGRARALYQAVLPMVAQGSASYTRARQRIDQLARSRPVDEDE